MVTRPVLKPSNTFTNTSALAPRRALPRCVALHGRGKEVFAKVFETVIGRVRKGVSNGIRRGVRRGDRQLYIYIYIYMKYKNIKKKMKSQQL